MTNIGKQFGKGSASGRIFGKELQLSTTDVRPCREGYSIVLTIIIHEAGALIDMNPES